MLHEIDRVRSQLGSTNLSLWRRWKSEERDGDFCDDTKSRSIEFGSWDHAPGHVNGQWTQ